MKIQAITLTILFILSVMLLITLVIGFYTELKERKLPRWKRVFYYLRREFLQHDFIHSQHDVIEVKLILIDKYKLTVEQANGALDNIYDEEWFELNIN